MVDLFLHTVRTVIVLAAWPASMATSFAEAPVKTKSPPEPELAVDFDEAIMKHFQRATDTASLLGYLKEKSISNEDLLAIPSLIERLGNDRHAQRREAMNKLVAIGLPAFMPLHAALRDPDPERARMAKLAIENLDRGTHTVAVPSITIHMLVKRKPPELLDVLLGYLPSTTDPEVEEDIYYGIDELAIVDGSIHPALLRALDDQSKARRALAGCIIARVGNREQKEQARKLLKDNDILVRLRTAQGFLAGMDNIAIPTLIDLLDATPVPIAWQAEELLVWAAHGNSPTELVWAGGDQATRAKAAWRQWWSKNHRSVDLTLAPNHPLKPRLFSSQMGAVLVGCDGRIRWEPWGLKKKQPLRRVTCMPNGQLIGVLQVVQPADVDEPENSHFRLCETTLEHETILQTAWRATHHDCCEIAANGVATISFHCFVLSIGLEGSIIANYDISDIIRFAAGRSAQTRGAYNGLLVMTIHSNRQVSEWLLLDPLSKTIVYRKSFNADGPNPRGFACSNKNVLMRDVGALWIVESGKPLQRVKEVELESRDAIGVLRHQEFVKYSVTNGEISVHCYSNFYKTVGSAKVDRNLLSDGVIRSPFGLVTFGFH